MSEFFPTCQDVFLTLPAGAESTRAASGEVLAIIAATSAFELAFDSGAMQYADAGFTYRGNADGGRRPRFSQLRFRNPNAFPIDIRVQVSNGEIFDNRAIFGAGSVPVAPAPGAVFEVDFNGPQPINIADAILPPSPYRTSDGGSIRVLGSLSVDGSYSANATLVTAAANANGLILRTAFLQNIGGSAYGHIKAAGVAILGGDISASGAMAAELFVPAGQAITLVRLAGTLHVAISYDLL